MQELASHLPERCIAFCAPPEVRLAKAEKFFAVEKADHHLFAMKVALYLACLVLRRSRMFYDRQTASVSSTRLCRVLWHVALMPKMPTSRTDDEHLSLLSAAGERLITGLSIPGGGAKCNVVGPSLRQLPRRAIALIAVRSELRTSNRGTFHAVSSRLQSAG